MCLYSDSDLTMHDVRCKFNKNRTFKICLGVVLTISFCIGWYPIVWAVDHEDLQTVIKDYLEAERSKNFDRMWDLLAPSSVIKRFYPYENYLAMMRLNPVRLISYELQFSPVVFENQDGQNLPNVEKIASVVVKEQLEKESGKEVNELDVLIFVFENGRWYKS